MLAAITALIGDGGRLFFQPSNPPVRQQYVVRFEFEQGFKKPAPALRGPFSPRKLFRPKQRKSSRLPHLASPGQDQRASIQWSTIVCLVSCRVVSFVTHWVHPGKVFPCPPTHVGGGGSFQFCLVGLSVRGDQKHACSILANVVLSACYGGRFLVSQYLLITLNLIASQIGRFPFSGGSCQGFFALTTSLLRTTMKMKRDSILNRLAAKSEPQFLSKKMQ